MPALTLSAAKNPKRSRQASQPPSTLPTLTGRALSLISASQYLENEPRRSQRVRRPSLHKLESDEYEASSRGSSRPASPSEPKGSKKSKKKPFGERGDRPGRIAQPNINAGTTGYGSSLEPLATSGSQLGDSFLAGRGPASDIVEIVRMDKADAVRRATDFLGADASHLSAKTLKKVLEEISASAEAADTGPMEIEGGSAPAVLQSARRVVLGGGQQPPARGIADVVNAPGTPGQSHLEAPRNADTATESESEPEFMELGPDDSVSQRPPFALLPIRTRPVPSPRPTTIPRTHSHVGETRPTNHLNRNSSAGSSSSDLERSLETARARKRQRLAQPLQRTKPPLPRTPHPTSSTIEFAMHSAHSSTHIPPAIPARSLISSGARARPTTNASSALSQSLPTPPSTSDVSAVLAWVARLAKQAAHPQTATNGASTSRQVDQPENPYDTLAQVLGDLRSHLAAPASGPQTNTRQPPRRPRHTDLVEDNAEILEAEAALALGRHLRPRHKPTLSDFPGLPRRIASLAIPELIATACTKGAYETFGTFDDWADDVYNTVWEREVPDSQLVKAPRPLRAIMIRRISWFHGEMKTRVHPAIPSRLPFINPPQTPEDLQFNRSLAKTLLPNAFHCGDPDTEEDPYEHPMLQECIAARFFWGPDALGALYHEKFRPIPLPAVAMVLTTMQHCIKEWKTGRFVPIVLDADKQLKMYKSHLKGLLAYAEKAPTRLGDFQLHWFKYALDYAGISLLDDEPYQPITQADRICPDTPTPDAYGEAHARGKERAVH